MKRPVLAVCDVEEGYARSFLAYLNARERMKLPFDFRAFTNAGELKDYAADHEIEILLISERAADESVRALPAGKLIILTEGQTLPELESYAQVYKYQSADRVVREVLDCYGAEKLAAARPARRRQRGRLAGVYSPASFSQRMLFSLTLGQILAGNQAVLYVCLDGYSGLTEMLRPGEGASLSDLLYTYRRKGTVTEAHLREALCRLRQLDCAVPAVAPEDLQSLSGSEWSGFMDALLQAGRYDVLVLDLGDVVRDLPEVLETCGEIWLPLQADVLSAAREKQFENSLKSRHPSLAAKTRPVYPPRLELAGTHRQMLEELPDGELGAFVRRMLA